MNRSRLAAAWLAATLSLACLALSAQAQAQGQWKWRDKNGQITVSDLPPPRDIPQQDILQRPDPSNTVAAPAVGSAPAPASAVPALRAPVDPELQARKQASEQEQAAKAKAEEDKLAAQRRQNCSNARSSLAALDSGQRIARFNAKGEREILDDKQRAAETQRARAVVASDCR
jgi:hypothetical protein